jgi:hypothetical protein
MLLKLKGFLKEIVTNWRCGSSSTAPALQMGRKKGKKEMVTSFMDTLVARTNDKHRFLANKLYFITSRKITESKVVKQSHPAPTSYTKESQSNSP